jgi:dTDP-4-amino-4,6-dideoxygalactose transaminase
LCLHGISKDAWNRYTERGRWFYEVVDCGFKYNLSDIQSAIGVEQLRQQETFRAKREEYARFYQNEFAQLVEIETPESSREGRHSWHLYVVRLNLNMLETSRDEFIEELREMGVGTSVHFIPIPQHPYYSQQLGLTPDQCPKAMALYPRILSLPLYPDLAPDEIEYIAASVKSIVHRTKKRKIFAAAS